jgi:protein-S-isoprenylcysteine O-methyltransferase Ste14
MTYVVRTVGFCAFCLVMGGLAAGRWDWLGAWLFATMLSGGMAAQFVLLAKYNPDLLKERVAVADNTKRWDRWLMPLTVVVLPLASLIVAGLDVRFAWTTPFSTLVQWTSIPLGLLAYSLTLISMVSNRFFSGVVRIQTERNHALHTAGPYRWVRHPGYVGMIGFFVAVPFLLGSPMSVVPTLVGVGLHILRTALEDRTLLAELPGYREYAERVRFRLIPGVW